ncbi:serine/threonine-protein kinase [Candidatus Uabimicrobium sp. HlEnr_7]|uniref:serine/threonine-protein kinase n=1 Tax=Candidatus Uabimicrobium helgolandensis TaxID=3095367 RepID=UPI003558F7AF
MQTLHSKYKLGKIIGQGGMGRVYIGYNIQTKEQVAVKQIIFPVNNRSQTRERAVREYEFLAAMDHPNIVKALDFYEVGDHIFLVMEYAKGISLEKIIKEKPSSLSLKEQLAIAIQISQAVALVNTAGIIHRDIKPLNIVIDEQQKNVKLLDLGLGKNLEKRPNDLTQGNAIGTPAYMSPEQIEGIVCKNSDVFSVGIVLYQFLLWLKLSPFQKKTAISTWNAVTNSSIKSLWDVLPEQIKKDVPIYQKISSLIEITLEKNSEDRMASCQELADELSIIYQELKTDSTTIIHDERTSRNKWQPSIEVSSEEIKKLHKLRAKYGNDFDLSRIRRYTTSRRKKSSNRLMYVVMLCFLLTGLVLGTIINQFFMGPKVLEVKAPKITQLSLLEEKLQSCILLARKKNYEMCAQKIYELEKIENLQIYTNDPLCKLTSYFYNGKWQKAMQLTPLVLRNKKYGPIGFFYSLRIFACLGQYHLLLVYSNIFEKKYPQLQSQLFHPVCSYGVGQLEEAFYRLSNWNTYNKLQLKEKMTNDAFLQFFILCNSTHSDNWKPLEDFIESKLKNTTFAHTFPLLKAHVAKEYPKINKLATGLFSLYPNLPEFRYFYVLSTLRKNKNPKDASLLYHIEKDYPDFFLASIVLGNSPNLDLDLLFNHLLTAAYDESIATCSISYFRDEKKLHSLLPVLEKNKSLNSFHYQYKINTRLEKKSSLLLRKLIRCSPQYISTLQKKGHKFKDLSLEQELLFFLDLCWFFHSIEEVKELLPLYFQKRCKKAQQVFIKEIPQLIKGKPNIFSLVANYKKVSPHFLLTLYKKSSEAMKGQILRCLLTQNYDRVSQILPMYVGKDAYKLKTIYTINQLSKSTQSQFSSEQAHKVLSMLESCSKQDPDYHYDIVYSLQLLRIQNGLQNIVEQKVYQRLYKLSMQTLHYHFFHSKRFPTSDTTKKFVKYPPLNIQRCFKQIRLYRKLHKLSLAYRYVKFSFYLLKLQKNKETWYRKLEEMEKLLRKTLDHKQ